MLGTSMSGQAACDGDAEISPMADAVATDGNVKEVARVVVVIIVKAIMNPSITACRIAGVTAVLGVNCARVCPYAGVAFDGVVDTRWRPVANVHTHTDLSVNLLLGRFFIACLVSGSSLELQSIRPPKS